MEGGREEAGNEGDRKREKRGEGGKAIDRERF